MYIVVSKSSGRLWVSGVFKYEKDLNEYIINIPHDIENEIFISSVKRYPLYIVEVFGEKFEFLNKDELSEYILEFMQSNRLEEDKYYFNIYAIHSDFIPNAPGKDSMGGLFHHHVNKEFLKWVIIKGLKPYFKYYKPRKSNSGG